MIDIHCHILPGIDDGARTVTESIAMAEEAVKQGITKIIATPHHNNGAFENSGPAIVEAVRQFNDRLQQKQIPIEVLVGQETRIYGEMIEDLRKGEVITLTNNSKYVFVELPTSHVPNYTTQLLFDMQIAGYKPIIVHPERNNELLENPDKLYRIVKNGALTQVTAASLVGVVGKKVQRFANQLITANLTHFFASDSHNLRRRGFYMREALQYIQKHHGNVTAYQFMENSEAVIANEMVHLDAPERVTERRFFGIFR